MKSGGCLGVAVSVGGSRDLGEATDRTYKTDRTYMRAGLVSDAGGWERGAFYLSLFTFHLSLDFNKPG